MGQLTFSDTPLQQIFFPGLPHHNLWVKRDDLMHPEVSGNKWRKLSGILQAFPQAKKWITMGGAWSNHLLAVASAGKTLEVETHGYVRGDELNINSNPRLKRINELGMTLTFISRSEFRNLRELYRKEAGIHGKDLIIPEGGAMPEALTGVEKILDEFTFIPDHLILATGTGTTAAGLAMGIAKRKWPTKIFPVPVYHDPESWAYSEKMSGGNLNSSMWVSDQNYFNKKNPENNLKNWRTDWESITGLPCDPVYIKSASHAWISLCKTGVIAPHTHSVLIYTLNGGVTDFPK